MTWIKQDTSEMQKYTPALTIISIILLSWAMMNLQLSLQILSQRMSGLENKVELLNSKLNQWDIYEDQK